MPTERASVTHKFCVGGHEGYITVGMYEDGRPGEIFIKMSKEGSTLSGVMDGLALTDFARLAVRRAAEGVRRQVGQHALRALRHHRNANIRFVSSVLDYIARWLGGRFISSGLPEADRRTARGCSGSDFVELREVESMLQAAALDASNTSSLNRRDAHEGAPACSECGMLMVPNGACYKCENCGSTSGCS